MALVDIPSGTHISEIQNEDCQFAVMVAYNSHEYDFVVIKRYDTDSQWRTVYETDNYREAHSKMLKAYNNESINY